MKVEAESPTDDYQVNILESAGGFVTAHFRLCTCFSVSPFFDQLLPIFKKPFRGMTHCTWDFHTFPFQHTGIAGNRQAVLFGPFEMLLLKWMTVLWIRRRPTLSLLAWFHISFWLAVSQPGHRTR
jgi:hypothetical protein